jgi:transcriptional regulator with XRE-family HTH domain
VLVKQKGIDYCETMEDTLTPASIRAARGLLDWSRVDLSAASGVAASTINAIENGRRERAAYPATVAKLVAAFRNAGVEVLPPPADGARRIVD